MTYVNAIYDGPQFEHLSFFLFHFVERFYLSFWEYFFFLIYENIINKKERLRISVI